MSALAKVFVVFVFLLSVTFFGTSATLYLTREDWSERYEEREKNIEENVTKLESRMKELKQAYDLEQDARKKVARNESNLQNLLEKANGDIEQLTTKVVTADADRDKARAQQEVSEKLSTSLTEQLETVKTQLQAAHDARAEAVDLQKVATAERFRIKTVLDETQRELRDARVALQDTTDRYESLELAYGAIEKKLGKDGIEAILSGLVAPPIDALVEEVDSNLRLVVLSVGKKDEVKEGYEFTVYREDQFVGKVRVHKVFENLAGARVLFTAAGGDIRQGDRATTRIN